MAHKIECFEGITDERLIAAQRRAYDEGYAAATSDVCDEIIIRLVHEIYRMSEEHTANGLLIVKELVNVMNQVSKLKESNNE